MNCMHWFCEIYIFQPSTFPHLLCFEEAERIFSSWIKTKWGYFRHLSSTERSVCNLVRPDAVQSSRWETNSIPKHRSCTHPSFKWVRNFNKSGNVKNRNVGGRTEFHSTKWEQSTPTATRPNNDTEKSSFIIWNSLLYHTEHPERASSRIARNDVRSSQQILQNYAKPVSLFQPCRDNMSS